MTSHLNRQYHGRGGGLQLLYQLRVQFLGTTVAVVCVEVACDWSVFIVEAQNGRKLLEGKLLGNKSQEIVKIEIGQSRNILEGHNKKTGHNTTRKAHSIPCHPQKFKICFR